MTASFSLTALRSFFSFPPPSTAPRSAARTHAQGRRRRRRAGAPRSRPPREEQPKKLERAAPRVRGCVNTRDERLERPPRASPQTQPGFQISLAAGSSGARQRRGRCAGEESVSLLPRRLWKSRRRGTRRPDSARGPAVNRFRALAGHTTQPALPTGGFSQRGRARPPQPLGGRRQRARALGARGLPRLPPRTGEPAAS